MSPDVKSEPERAAEEARVQFLRQQALTLINTTRGLRIQLMMAVEAQELPPQLREHLFKEMLQCAAVVEVKK